MRGSGIDAAVVTVEAAAAALEMLQNEWKLCIREGKLISVLHSGDDSLRSAVGWLTVSNFQTPTNRPTIDVICLPAELFASLCELRLIYQTVNQTLNRQN